MSFYESTPSAEGLLELLSDDERRMLTESGGTVQLSADQFLFQVGEPGGTLYIVESGTIEIYIKDNAGQKISLKTAEKGDFFGEISVFDGRPRTATAVAVTDCELLALSRKDLLAAFHQKPETALGMLAAMGAMLRDADKLLQTNVSRNVNDMMERQLTTVERITDWIAWFSGSIHFLVITAVWFIVWIAVNTLSLGISFFDPFPFGLLTMLTSLEAIFLSCFLLISQNRQAEKDRVRSDVEYEVNIKAEMEIAHLHEKTDRINEEMLENFARIESALTNLQLRS